MSILAYIQHKGMSHLKKKNLKKKVSLLAFIATIFCMMASMQGLNEWGMMRSKSNPTHFFVI